MLFTLSKHDIEGIPDGQTMDKDGNLWVAIFSGSKVIKIDSRKPETLLDAIVLPVPQVILKASISSLFSSPINLADGNSGLYIYMRDCLHLIGPPPPYVIGREVGLVRMHCTLN